MQLIASGANTYNWTNSSISVYDSIYVSPIATSTFYLTGEDGNGCINSDSITISVNNLPNITIDNISPICYGDSITLNATGGVLYLWSGGISNNSSFVPDSSQIFIVLSLIHISEPTRRVVISYAVFCLKKKRKALTTTSTCAVFSGHEA